MNMISHQVPFFYPALLLLSQSSKDLAQMSPQLRVQHLSTALRNEDHMISLFQFRYEPETTGDRQCEASRSVVDRKSISVVGEGSVMSINGTRRAAARQAEGKARGEPVGNGGTASRLSIALCCEQRPCPTAGARLSP